MKNKTSGRYKGGVGLDISDVVILAGFSLLSYGLYCIFPPMMHITLGVLLLILGFKLNRKKVKE